MLCVSQSVPTFTYMCEHVHVEVHFSASICVAYLTAYISIVCMCNVDCRYLCVTSLSTIHLPRVFPGYVLCKFLSLTLIHPLSLVLQFPFLLHS